MFYIQAFQLDFYNRFIYLFEQIAQSFISFIYFKLNKGLKAVRYIREGKELQYHFCFWINKVQLNWKPLFLFEDLLQ